MLPASNVNRTSPPSTSPETHQATSLTSSAERRSKEYDVNPRTLKALAKNRERLAGSENAAARTLGAALKRIHEQLTNKEITPQEHGVECTKIREASETIVGYADVGNDVLAEVGLQGIDGLTLTDGEYLAINADIGRQLNAENGVLATREEVVQAARNEADRGRASLGRFFSGVGTAMLEWTQENPTVFAAVAVGSMGNVLNDAEAEWSREVNQRSDTDSGSAPGQGTEAFQQRPGEGGADDSRRH